MEGGEFDLIAKLVERMPPPGPRLRVASGDDAAVTEPSGRATATTIDTVVQGVHFVLPDYPLEAVGRKALAAALSDLAAMGAEPGEAYVSLGAPDSLDQEELLRVGDGMAEVAAREGVSVAGGDVTRAPALTLTVACVGYEPAGSEFVTRAGAAAGDVLAVTGDLGAAAGALEAPEVEQLAARQHDPRPRFAAGRALAEAGAHAMIDVSDGLGADAGHMAKASGTRIEIELETLPIGEALVSAFGEEKARELAAAGGEDFELLAAIPPERLEEAVAAVEALGERLTQVGRVVQGEGVSIRDAGGNEVEPRGFDHMRGSRSGSG
jgi:thiamine-monophosphate kinase